MPAPDIEENVQTPLSGGEPHITCTFCFPLPSSSYNSARIVGNFSCLSIMHALLMDGSSTLYYFFIFRSPCRWGSEYIDWIRCGEIRPSHKKRRDVPGYGTKLHLIVRFQFWKSGEYGVLLHYLVFSNPELYDLLKNCSYSIGTLDAI